MFLRPLHDRILVKVAPAKESSVGGIIIPDSAKEKPVEGEVVAVGNGTLLKDGAVRPLDVKVGDRVLFSKYAGTEVKFGDKADHLILREEDVFGVLRGKYAAS